MRRRVPGRDHADTVESIARLGKLLAGAGEHEGALPYHREALECCRRILGDDDWGTLTSNLSSPSIVDTVGPRSARLAPR